MWRYEKRLQYPVNIKEPNAQLAQFIMSQYGGPYCKNGCIVRSKPNAFLEEMNYGTPQKVCPSGYLIKHTPSERTLRHKRYVVGFLFRLTGYSNKIPWFLFGCRRRLSEEHGGWHCLWLPYLCRKIERVHRRFGYASEAGLFPGRYQPQICRQVCEPHSVNAPVLFAGAVYSS